MLKHVLNVDNEIIEYNSEYNHLVRFISTARNCETEVNRRIYIA